MTREEAINELRELWHRWKTRSVSEGEAINVAIKALEAQYEDAISRQTAIRRLNDEYHGMISDESMKIYQIIDFLNALPSVTPKQETGYWILHENGVDKSKVDEIGDCIAMVIDEPSVTPKQRTGHWIDTDPDDACWYMCSKCHRRTDEKSDYCPNCGAKMVETQEE